MRKMIALVAGAMLIMPAMAQLGDDDVQVTADVQSYIDVIPDSLQTIDLGAMLPGTVKSGAIAIGWRVNRDATIGINAVAQPGDKVPSSGGTPLWAFAVATAPNPTGAGLATSGTVAVDMEAWLQNPAVAPDPATTWNGQIDVTANSAANRVVLPTDAGHKELGVAALINELVDPGAGQLAVITLNITGSSF